MGHCLAKACRPWGAISPLVGSRDKVLNPLLSSDI